MTGQAHAVPPHRLAPWAEIVPNAPRMSVADLATLPDDEWQYELVEGVLVRMPLSGGEASNIGMRLGGWLSVFVEDHGLGAVTGEAGGYDFCALGQLDTELAPDVALVRAEHVPPRTSPEYAKAWPVAPDLVVEVASPYQWRPGKAAKVGRYLAAGVRLVWVVWPRWQQVDVWHPGTHSRRVPLGWQIPSTVKTQCRICLFSGQPLRLALHTYYSGLAVAGSPWGWKPIRSLRVTVGLSLVFRVAHKPQCGA